MRGKALAMAAATAGEDRIFTPHEVALMAAEQVTELSALPVFALLNNPATWDEGQRQAMENAAGDPRVLVANREVAGRYTAGRDRRPKPEQEAQLRDLLTAHLLRAVLALHCDLAVAQVAAWPVGAGFDAKSDAARGAFANRSMDSIQICANVVNLLADDLAPLVLRDRAAASRVVNARLGEMSLDELRALYDVPTATSLSLDYSGFQGVAWSSDLGRFENTGRGFVWLEGGMTQWGDGQVMGLRRTLALESSSTLRQSKQTGGSSETSASASESATAGAKTGGQ